MMELEEFLEIGFYCNHYFSMINHEIKLTFSLLKVERLFLTFGILQRMIDELDLRIFLFH